MTRSDLALAAIACAAVPGMHPATVQEVRRTGQAEPSAHQTAIIEDETGRTWVVRVPLTAAAGAELERNEALVGQLGKHLPFKVPAAAGFASLGPNLGRAAVYPHVDGSALNLHQVPAGAGLASAVGRAVAAVHNIPVELFEEYAVPTFDASEHRQRCVSELDRAAATGLVPTGLLARWEEALDAPALWNFAPTPVHGSLDGWAFLVAFADDDAASARVVALTHWDNACVSDPAQDFAALADQLTPAALDSVLESYSLARSSRPDPHLLNRARLAAEMHLIAGLAHAASSGADDVVQGRVDELRKLDRLTAADSSLVPQRPVGEHEVGPESESSVGPRRGLAVEPEPAPHAPVGQGHDSAASESAEDSDEDDDAVEVEAGDSRFVRLADASGAEGSSHRPERDEVAGREPQQSLWSAPEEGPFAGDDATEVLTTGRLGEELDEPSRLQDLYGMPADDEAPAPRPADETASEAAPDEAAEIDQTDTGDGQDEHDHRSGSSRGGATAL
ncbi:MAG: phosphotransferase [Ornithinimicrobium sp.]